MREWKYIALMLALLLSLAIIGCEKEEPADETDAIEGESIETGAIEGDPIETSSEDVGEPVDDGLTGEVDDPDPLPAEATESVIDPEPLERPVTLDDLVYPTYNSMTGEITKEPAPDPNEFTVTSSDPFSAVWAYYTLLLSKRITVIEDNSDQPGAPPTGSIKVIEEENTFEIALIGTPNSGLTIIQIAKS